MTDELIQCDSCGRERLADGLVNSPAGITCPICTPQGDDA